MKPPEMAISWIQLSVSKQARIKLKKWTKRNNQFMSLPDIQARCKLKNIEVIGLLVGARGTIPKFFSEICKKFKIEKSVVEDIGIEALRGSRRILANHLYDPKRC